jgi:hypothetical protein
MWPSLSVANQIADWANIFFIGSLVVGVVSTILIVWMANVKEGYWERARQDSEEKIAAVSSQGEEAKAELGIAQADIAKATARIAEADARTKEAELKLEQLRVKIRRREISRRFLDIMHGKPVGPVEIWFVKDDPEAFALAMQIRDFLNMAGWAASEPVFIPPTTVKRMSQYPSTMGAGGQPAGVTLVVWADSNADFAALEKRDALTPLNALLDALGDSLGQINMGANSETAPPRGTIRIVVGSKPP